MSRKTRPSEKKCVIAAQIATFLFFTSHPLLSADWPHFRGPDHNGISPEKGIRKDWVENPPPVVWKVSMNDEGYAGPSVAKGILYIVDHEGSEDVVRALDVRDGREIWTFAYPDSSPDNYGYARATPAVDGGRVYTIGRFGLVHCLDSLTGRKIWSRNIIDDFDGVIPKYEMSMSPFIDGEKLIVFPGGKVASVVALDKKTGRTIWEGGGSDKPGYATPVAATIGGRRQYIAFTGHSLLGVGAEKGDLLWRLPWKTNHDVNAATPVVVGDDVFITSGYNHGCALVRVGEGEPEILWENRNLVGHFNSPVYSEGYIYGIGDPGEIVCLDLNTGRLMWSEKGFEKGGLVAVDGMLIALAGRTGDLVLIEMTPMEYRERGRTRPLGGRSWTAPVISEGILYIRNEDSLAGIDLR
jgi:outer membrane protein assembly factor BamB